MFMKNILPLLFMLLLSCSEKTEPKEETKLKTLYKISIYDTLEIEARVPSLRVLDYSDKRLLLTNLMGGEVYQTDFSGKLIHSFNPMGNEPNQVGPYAYGIGYIGDSTISVIGTNGLFQYDLNGKLKSSYQKKINTIRGGSLARRFKLVDCQIDNQPYLIGIWLSPFSEKEKALVNKDYELYKKLKFLTVFNLENQKYYIDLPFEKNSIFVKNANQYDEAYCFDYNASHKTLYTIISPDNYVNIYTLTSEGFKLKKSVELITENFQLRKILPFGNVYEQEQIYVNSEFRTLDVSQDGKYCLVSYRTGIPIEEYRKAKSNAEIPLIHRQFNKRYVILLENDTQTSAPILLPKDVKEVVFFKSIDYILLSTDSFENPDKTSFYVARLEKVQ